MRFSLAFRGYRMSEVDALLDRLAGQLEADEADEHDDAPGGWRRSRNDHALRVRQTAGRETRVRRLRAHRSRGGRRGAHPTAAEQGSAGRPASTSVTGSSTCTRSSACSRSSSGWCSWSPEQRPGRLVVAHRRAGCAGSAHRRTADPGALAAQPRPARVRAGVRTAGRTDPGSRSSHTSACWSACSCSPGYLPRRADPHDPGRPRGRPGRRAAPPRDSPPRRGRVRAAYAHRVIGHTVAGRPIVAWHLGETHQPKVVLIADDARQRAGAHRRSCAPCATASASTASTCGWCRRTTPTAWPADPAATPTASTSTATTPTTGRRSTATTSPAPAPRSEPETRAMMGFLREGTSGLGAQLPPAAARRGHRHQAAGVRAPGGPHPRPADHHARLRRRLPRHDDRLVQRPLPGLRAHRRVRRAAAAPPDDADGARARCCGSSTPGAAPTTSRSSRRAAPAGGTRASVSFLTVRDGCNGHEGSGHPVDRVFCPPVQRPSKTGFSLATNACDGGAVVLGGAGEGHHLGTRRPGPPRRCGAAA